MLSLHALTRNAHGEKGWKPLLATAKFELEGVLNHNIPAGNWLAFMERQLSSRSINIGMVGAMAICEHFGDDDDEYEKYLCQCYCSLTPLSRWLAHPRVHEYVFRSDWAMKRKPILASYCGEWTRWNWDMVIALTAVIIIMHTEGYLRLDCGNTKPKTRRFFRIAARLPLKLQEVLARRVWNEAGSHALPKTDEEWRDAVALIAHE